MKPYYDDRDYALDTRSQLGHAQTEWALVMVGMLGMFGFLATEAYTLPAWMQWVGAIGAAAAGITAIAVIWRWVGNHLRSWRLDYTDASLRHDVSMREQTLKASGSMQHLYIRVRVVTRTGVDFVELSVRAVVGVRTLWGTTHRLLPTKPAPADRNTIQFIHLADAEEVEFGQGADWHHRMVTRQAPDARAQIIGTYTPSYRRVKGETLFLRVGVRATKPWRGHVAVALPNAAGARVFRYLPLTVTQ